MAEQTPWIESPIVHALRDIHRRQWDALFAKIEAEAEAEEAAFQRKARRFWTLAVSISVLIITVTTAAFCLLSEGN